jgi:signal transduction histidine kinase
LSGAPIVSVQVRSEQDVVLSRQRARRIAESLGFTMQEQTAFATAVSELARNAFQYGGGGRVDFTMRIDEQPQVLVVRVSDNGPGIANLRKILDGRYRSETGMGLGIVGSRRLSDEFDITSVPGRGTIVTLGKQLPRRTSPLTMQALGMVAEQLAHRGPQSPFQEVQEQNRALLLAMDDLRARQGEVERLNAELAETNRGVVALYAELDEKAESLRRASEYKSRFLSDMTHELRTPLNAIVSLSRILLDRLDGELTAEQERQVSLIHRSATSLGEMVNDLLDLAKIEAGKTDVHVASFSVAELLTALRGIFRPLATDGRVTLTVEEPPTDLATMHSDERKVSQILRNLVSNALKFTEQGEVRVRVERTADGMVAFNVADTGIGIAPEHIAQIFDDFTQIDSGVQRRLRGTGLGLPLTRKLARLLGGDVAVTSAPGEGSTFVVTLVLNLEAPTTDATAEPLQVITTGGSDV